MLYISIISFVAHSGGWSRSRNSFSTSLNASANSGRAPRHLANGSGSLCICSRLGSWAKAPELRCCRSASVSPSTLHSLQVSRLVAQFAGTLRSIVVSNCPSFQICPLYHLRTLISWPWRAVSFLVCSSFDESRAVRQSGIEPHAQYIQKCVH